MAVAVVAVVLIATVAMVVLVVEPDFLRGPGMGGDAVWGPSLRCSIQSVEPLLTDGMYTWNITASLSDVRAGTSRDRILWSELQMGVQLDHRLDDGEFIVPMQAPTPRASAAPRFNTLFYEELAGDPLAIDEGDAVGILYADRSVEKTSLVLTLARGPSVAGVYIREFEQEYSVTLGECQVTVPNRGLEEWDAVVEVKRVEPSWERVDVRCFFLDPDYNGQPHYPIEEYHPEVMIDRATPRIFHVSAHEGDDTLRMGDSLMVTGLPQAWTFKTLHLKTGGIYRAEFGVPAYLPSPHVNITLGDLRIRNQPYVKSATCEVGLTVMSIEPADAMLAWADTTVQVVPRGFRRATVNMTPCIFVDGVWKGVMAYYEDAGRLDGLVSVGDRVIVTDLGQAYVSALVAVVKDGTLVGGFVLPDILMGLNSTLDLEQRGTQRRIVDERTVWDVTFEVVDVRLTSRTIPWNDIYATLHLAGGTQPFVNVAHVYKRPDAPGTHLTVYYEDTGSDDRMVSKGDRVVIECVGLDLERGFLNLAWNGTGLVNENLPSDLRSSDLSYVLLRLAPPTVTYAPSEGKDVWRLTINVSLVGPTDVTIPWREVRLHVYNASGGQHWTFLNVSGFEDTDGTRWSVSTNTWLSAFHLEPPTTDRIVSVGDTFGVVGLDASWAGGSIEVRVWGHVVTVIEIPSALPRA